MQSQKCLPWVSPWSPLLSLSVPSYALGPFSGVFHGMSSPCLWCPVLPRGESLELIDVHIEIQLLVTSAAWKAPVSSGELLLIPWEFRELPGLVPARYVKGKTLVNSGCLWGQGIGNIGLQHLIANIPGQLWYPGKPNTEVEVTEIVSRSPRQTCNFSCPLWISC